MKDCKLNVTFVLSFVIMLTLLPLTMNAQEAKKVIYETDMCADVDDAGGLAVLHALANNGEAEILAICFNEVHTFGAAAIDAMNTWYGRGDIPVGIYRGVLDNPHRSGYLEHVARFPHDLEKSSAPSALDVYRQVLAAQPDSSVTIISVGFLNNIDDLLTAEPALVAQKVKKLVQMAGVYNDGFNLVQHNLVSVSENVIRNWPTPLVISQEGGSIFTGDNFKNAPEENPVREAFYRFFGNKYLTRPSWDEMAVLYGVRGLTPYFNERTTGTGRLSNGYTWQMEPGFRSYLTNRFSNRSYERIIEDLMDQRPIGAHFNVSTSSGWIPFTAEFDASISNVGGNRSIQEYLWDFGDGASGEGEAVSHEYPTVGVFDVHLTIIDDLGDSLRTSDQIRVSDPVFSPIDYFGTVLNYEQNQEDLWSTRMDSGDLRLYLSSEQRDFELSMPGFSLVRDSIYSDFTLNIGVRTNEVLAQTRLADYSIIFGYQDEANYNQLLMKVTTYKLINVTNGQSIDIARITTKGIPDEEYHQLFINLSGEQITVTIDDTVFLETTSSSLLQEGKIGFGSFNHSMFFDDIAVMRLDIPTNIYHQANLPGKLRLWQNHPNPFNPSTKIKFTLPKSENVKIEVYNIMGQKIVTLLDKLVSAGYHEVEFNGQNLFSGIYWYRIEAGNFQDVKKMILLK